MIKINCPLCDSVDFTTVADVQDRLLGIEGQFAMVCCADCDLYYLNPQPTMAELARYYPEDYDPYQTPSLDELPALQRFSVDYGLSKRCRAVTRYKANGRLLEIGCANGLFLDAMRRRGSWQLQGLDVSEVAVRYAREELGLDVFCGSLEQAELSTGSFDAVVMWDVLEHVHQPRETLVEIRRLLKPDGVLVFRVPLLDSWDRKLFGPYWAGWDAPRHLTTFSKQTLTTMLDKAGFHVERIASISGGYPTFALSIRFWARDRLAAAAQERLRRVLESLPVRLLTAPFFFMMDRLGKSTVATVVARPGGASESLDDGGL